jgi:hypothetical protein
LVGAARTEHAERIVNLPEPFAMSKTFFLGKIRSPKMPSAPEDYRLNAKACLRMANTTPQGINKAWFEQIAEQWLRMAEPSEEKVVRPSSD